MAAVDQLAAQLAQRVRASVNPYWQPPQPVVSRVSTTTPLAQQVVPPPALTAGPRPTLARTAGSRPTTPLTQQVVARPHPAHQGLARALSEFMGSVGQRVPHVGAGGAAGGVFTAGPGGVVPPAGTRVPPPLSTPGGAVPPGGGRVPPSPPTPGGAPRGPGKALALASQRFQSPPTAPAGPIPDPFPGSRDYLRQKTGFANWAKTFRNPGKVFQAARQSYQTGATAAGAGRLARLAGRAPGLAAGLYTLTAPLTVAWVADGLGINDAFEEGSKPDQWAEGGVVGASFGAAFGGPGALIGAVVGAAVNDMTDGWLVETARRIPWFGENFGASPGDFDWRDAAGNLYQQAAAAQGSPEVADAALAVFESYVKLIEAGKIPPGSEMQYLTMAGRQAGLRGFPWAPEELVPVYSADDIAQMTGAVSEELQPMFDAATGLMQQRFEYVQDPDVRARLIGAAQDSASSLMESAAIAMRGPAEAAIMSESQRRRADQDLMAQLGQQDEFAAMLANAAV